MDYGICNLSIVPVRKEPMEQSEMVTQMLFGEHFSIIQTTEKWCHIRISYDNSDGWIDRKMFHTINEDTFNNLQKLCVFCTEEIISEVRLVRDKTTFNIVLGSVLPFYKDKKFYIGKNRYFIEAAVKDITKIRLQQIEAKDIIATALKYLNAPYLWGGRSPFGIDCSGFTQMVFKLNGINLPRNSEQQAELGENIYFIQEAQPADLAFFSRWQVGADSGGENEVGHQVIRPDKFVPMQGNIVHVGIICDKNKIIHCSGKVRIDKIDHQGIYNTETEKYTHKLKVIKRVV